MLNSEDKITQVNFDKIKSGMALEQVKAIIGEIPGEELLREDIKKGKEIRAVIYGQDGKILLQFKKNHIVYADYTFEKSSLQNRILSFLQLQ